jgi:DNA-binding NarL/FixJ family response regulator
MERGKISKPVRVLLVEDSANVREAIASEFEADPRFEDVGQVASMAEGTRLASGG